MNPYPLNPNDWAELTRRVLLAVLVGGAIGFNREIRGKAAGLRTHMLVSLGAALLVMIPAQLPTPGGADAIARVIQGIAAGIGFLGAGEILHIRATEPSHERVKGLTSAAAVWVAAGLGAVAGCGLWQLALVGMVVTLSVLELAWQAERAVERRKKDQHL